VLFISPEIYSFLLMEEHGLQRPFLYVLGSGKYLQLSLMDAVEVASFRQTIQRGSQVCPISPKSGNET
jgi:hypothetical protein